MTEESELDMTDQPCKELQPITIVLESGEEIYAPVISKIRTFGTIDDPIFVAKDVQDALGLTNLQYKTDSYEWDIDKVKLKVQSGMGIRATIGLTEQGLYKAIWHSKSEVAKKFQMFMTCVMKRLRKTGLVTMEQANNDFKNKIAILEEKNKMLASTVKAYDIQMETEHKELIELRYNYFNCIEKYHNNEVELYKLKKENEVEKEIDCDERYIRLMKYIGKEIVVMSNEENYDIDEAEVAQYYIGLKQLKSKFLVKKLYVHKSITLQKITDNLIKFKQGTHYDITLELLDQIIDKINKEEEVN